MQKQLLVLGGGYSTVKVVEYAHKENIFVHVACQNNGDAAMIADKIFNVDLTDHQALHKYIVNNKIDGIMTGASEFHVFNMIKLAKIANIPCYATEEQWELCQNKRHFKDMCKKYHIPGVPEFSVDEVLKDCDFPVIVKPVDGCSSRGITICYNNEELKDAKEKARKESPSGKMLIEKYIDNGGITLDAKYVAINGEYYLEAFGENVVQGLITAVAKYPSHYIDLFIKKVDPFIREMFHAIGFENGPFFFQALPDGDNIYVYEMGLRVSGGMIYQITEATSGNNTQKMLIHYAVNGEMCSKEDVKMIDPYLNGKHSASISVPIREGKISSIEGLSVIQSFNWVVDITQYYHVHDIILPKYINTLDQLFARIIVKGDSEIELHERMKIIRNTVKIFDENGCLMNDWSGFDKKYNH